MPRMRRSLLSFWLSIRSQSASNTRPASSCPLIVDTSNAALQPLRIAPGDVARKNRRGCLSAYDAIYAADGCPLKLCGQGKGIIPLPASSGQGTPGSPQLPPP